MIDLQTLRAALGGEISNGQLLCPGPGHSRRDRSLAVRPSPDGDFVVYSHAGDDWRECSDYVRSALGLPPWNSDVEQRHHGNGHHAIVDGDAQRVERARAIWNGATDPRGTIVERYLASRRLDLPPELCGTVLRFHSRTPWEGGTIPCLIACFRSISGDTISGIHRIRLDQPERWPKAERKMKGVVAGSAVKLDPAADCLVIGEGLETCLAARQLGIRPAWALGSANRIAAFPLIAGVEELVILGENDNGQNRRAAEACRERWQGRTVTIITPRTADDMNSILLGGQ